MQSALRPGSSVVERGPEKAGVGGSIPSLDTIPSFHPVPPHIKFPLNPLLPANQSTTLPRGTMASPIRLGYILGYIPKSRNSYANAADRHASEERET
jgi:hypothetical protein